MRVVVTGARGQLGGSVVEEFATAHDVVALDRAALDLTDPAAVLDAMTTTRPDVIINCSGYNDVDGAETHPIDALQVNAFAIRTLARSARAVDATLVHYSTDFVFDGTAPRLLTEEDPPNPRSVYAASKLLGEWFASDAPTAFVLRVESLFGQARSGGVNKGSIANIVKAITAGAIPKVFSDRTVSPTFVPDAARATRELLERRAQPGLYHCVNTGSCTWLELATEAARGLGVEPRLEAVRFGDVRLPAVRPQYAALSNQKMVSAGIVMPTWQDALARYLAAR